MFFFALFSYVMRLLICLHTYPRKNTSLGESLVGSHAYNPIRDSRQDFSRQKVSLRVSDRIICMTPSETLSKTCFLRGV